MAKNVKGQSEVQKKASKLERLIVTYVPISAVTPNDYNPNRQSEHEFELLRRSMGEDGFTQPVVAVSDPKEPVIIKDGNYAGGKVVIVDGEHRWRCACELGYKEIPVAITPMTVEQARIATLRHNKARGSHDIELEAQVLRDLRELGALDWAQDSLMLDDVELQRMLEDISAPEALASEEYGDAWDPASAHEDDGLGEPRTEYREAQGGKVAESATPDAVRALREREARIKAAKSDQERESIRKESDTYRLVCMFTGEEAKVVREVLGSAPAKRVLDLCQGAKDA